MGTEPKIVQPVVFIPPTIETPDPGVEDPDADRFIEDTSVHVDLTFEQWVANHRPPPPVAAASDEFADDVPTD